MTVTGGDLSAFPDTGQSGAPPDTKVHQMYSLSEGYGVCVKHHRQAESRSDGQVNTTSSDESLSSVEDDNVSPLRAVQFRGKNNRSVGSFSASYYSTMDVEETESTSSGDNSTTFEPLQFSFAVGARRVASYMPESIAYSVSEEDEGCANLSASEKFLDVDTRSAAGHFARSEVLSKRYQTDEFISGVCNEEPDQVPLQALYIKNLIKRLKDPDREITLAEFENLDWDDPNFETQLQGLRKVATYVEAREIMVKSATHAEMRISDHLDEEIKEAINKIPEIMIAKNETEHAHRIMSSSQLDNSTIGCLIPRTADGWLEGVESSVRGASEMSLFEGKELANVRQSVLLLPRVKIRKNCNESMTSKCDGSYVLKETILAEAPKHTRRKRATKSCHSQVFDIICDDHADEIVEEDITRDSEKHAEAAQQENVRMHTEEILSRKKRRKQRCNRSVSFLFDSIGDEGGSAVLRESATLCGKKKIRSTRRQPRKTNERSVTFTHIEEMERACEVSEALDNTGFDPPSETVSPAKHTRMKSLRRSSSPRGGNPNFTIVEVPEDHVETIIEGDFGIMNLTSRIHSELNGSYQRNGEQNMPLPHIHKDTKDKLCGPITTPQDTVRSSNKLRKRRKEDLHKSRQLECSFVQDEIMVEIQELDNESMQLKHCSSHIPKESNVKMGGDVMADSITLNTTGSSILPDIPSMNSPKHGLRHKRTTAHVVNVTKLPEVLASEVPDVIADSMCSTSA